jgi:predicted metal-binding membrane protein
VSAVAALVALSWWVLVVSHTGAGHHRFMHPHSGPGLPATFAMWMVMMLAMMLPPVMPWILLFATASRRREGQRRPYGDTALFTSGYFVIWAVFSLGAAVLQLALQRWALIDPLQLKTGPVAGGVVLVVAGAFQWTPLKSACLKHCRSPLGFFLSRWDDGPAGALRMGLTHGIYCLTCCWGLMIVSFALGTMNLLWMALLTLMLCVEKIAPAGGFFSRLFGVALVVWGLWLIAF